MLWSLNLTPDLSIGDEEHLLIGELCETRQRWFLAQALHRAHVGTERLVDSSIVGNVLSLCVLAIQLQQIT